MEQSLIPLLERIADALERIADAGGLGPAQPGTAAAGGQPTFAGYPAAWTVDAAGYPSYIATVDGELAYKHERQGDVWWSVKDDRVDGGYRRILTLKAGEALPAEAQWRPPTTPGEPENGGTAGPEEGEKPLRTAPAQPEAGDPGKKGAKPTATPEIAPEPPLAASDEAVEALHRAGRAELGEEWPKKGPEMVLAFTDGRTRSSREMTEAEAQAFIAELQVDTSACDEGAGGEPGRSRLPWWRDK